jgi:hypothetical protein
VLSRRQRGNEEYKACQEDRADAEQLAFVPQIVGHRKEAEDSSDDESRTDPLQTSRRGAPKVQGDPSVRR